MKLEEEKKLVAEKLGFMSVGPGGMPKIYTNKQLYNLEEWKPSGERKWWDEIWEKMPYEMTVKYLENILIPEQGLDDTFEESWFTHTAKPETCWKALIKTLQELNGNT